MGNIGMVLAARQTDICYLPATMEDATYETKEMIYDIINGRRIDKSGTDASGVSSFGDKIYRAHGGMSNLEK